MKQRTNNLLFADIANEMAEFDPTINKKDLSISFKGDFWINQHFYKQQYVNEGMVALASNLDFIPPDLTDDTMRKSLYQKVSGCDLDTLFLRAQTNVEGEKIQRMEIGRFENWNGSILQKNFQEFYLPALRSMLDASFCIDLLIGEEVTIANYKIKLRYTDGSRMISSIIGAYHLARIYQQFDGFYATIMEAANESMQSAVERDVLLRIMAREEVPEEFINLLND